MVPVALERNQWQKPIDAGAISERGKQQVGEQTERRRGNIVKHTYKFVPRSIPS